MAETAAPAAPPPLAESLTAHIDACHLHAMHPMCREGLDGLIQFILDACVKDRSAAKKLLAAYAVKGVLLW